jgi:Ser/Thr protein kinase RdoA (MazF antagonist)
MAMIETSTDWEQAIGRLLTALDHKVDAVRAMPAMSTTRAWRIDTNRGARVARVAFPRPGKAPRFAVDALVRARLAQLDSRVARPIAHSGDREELSHLVDGRAWAVDSFISGEDGARETVGSAIWADLGAVLAKLHRLAAGSIPGTAETRFQQAWPVDRRALAEHPIIAAAPQLLEPLSGMESRILTATRAPAVVSHGDPGPYNLRIKDDRMLGLIDFNDCFVGPAAWDFAWITVYSGWTATEATLSGYGIVDEQFRSDIHMLAIPTALHGASRAALLGQPDRMIRMARFLEDGFRAPVHL